MGSQSPHKQPAGPQQPQSHPAGFHSQPGGPPRQGQGRGQGQPMVLQLQYSQPMVLQPQQSQPQVSQSMNLQQQQQQQRAYLQHQPFLPQQQMVVSMSGSVFGQSPPGMYPSPMVTGYPLFQVGAVLEYRIFIVS